MPRLDAPRGPAGGRARANLRDLSTVCLSTIAAIDPAAGLEVGISEDFRITGSSAQIAPRGHQQCEDASRSQQCARGTTVKYSAVPVDTTQEWHCGWCSSDCSHTRFNQSRWRDQRVEPPDRPLQAIRRSLQWRLFCGCWRCCDYHAGSELGRQQEGVSGVA